MNGIVVRSKNRVLLEAATEALEAERPMTLRQLFYRLISAGFLDNAKREYNRLGALMTRAREWNEIPRTWIVDHVRSTLKPSSWSGLADFGDAVRESYRKNFWASLEHYVCIFCEKDAIAGTLQPVTREYDVPLHVCRGYSSVSFAGEIADHWLRMQKPIYACYVGDHDPSGYDLERDLREKLKRYSMQEFQWQRLAVTEQDFDAFDLIGLPVKRSDKRAKGFLAHYGERCAEVDALPPSELRHRVEDAILEHVDSWQWEKLQEVEHAEQATLEKLVGHWGKKAKLD